MLNVRLATIVGIIVVIVAVTGIYFYAQSRQEKEEIAKNEQKGAKQSPSPTKAVLPEFTGNSLPKTGEGGDCNSCREYLSGETLKECLAYLNCSQ